MLSRNMSHKSSLGEVSLELDCRQQHAIQQQYAADREEFPDPPAQFEGDRRPSLLAAAYGRAVTRLSEDWIFLALLGLIVATLSFAMDQGIDLCLQAREWLYSGVPPRVLTRMLAWLCLPVTLILAAVAFVHVVAPQSVGSGIPEMKTILRGGVLKEVLTFRTLVAKVIGLTAALGSGLPLGKEGALIHISSIVASLLSKLVTSRRLAYENESRRCEMLAAACAVGVATCFAAPIGGVLFSIEVTTVYFAVRNYWRGFFAAVCGATVFRLLAVWCEQEDTVVPLFATNFDINFPFDPQELFVFALMGVVCGVCGSLYVWIHRSYVKFIRRNKKVNNIMKKHKFLYSGVICLLAASLSFPSALGNFMAADLGTGSQVKGLFSNFSWSKSNLTVQEIEILSHWNNSGCSIFFSLAVFLLYNFTFGILCSTIPVPSGSFIPVFKVGAAFGRGVGELMALYFPEGLRYGKIIAPIIPGSYATVGAAAFSGSVTHTISVSVIVFEMTGQITHTFPIMIAVLISNGVASLLQPSLYDSIINIRKLPYLPHINPANTGAYHVYVEDFMIRNIIYIWHGITYKQLKDILMENKNLRSIPLVADPDSMILLGSVRRRELLALVRSHLEPEKASVVAQWREQRGDESEGQGDLNSPPEAPVTFTLEVQSANHLAPPTVDPMHGLEHGHRRSPLMPKSASFTLPSSLTEENRADWFHTLPRSARVRQAIQAVFSRSTELLHAESSQVSESDMTSQQREIWEAAQLECVAELSMCSIDPAPFQLVERTSLLKVHSLFCLLALQRAYVTKLGRLVGVVTLAQLRSAIEESNAGNLPRRSVDVSRTAEVTRSEVIDPGEVKVITSQL